MQNGLAQEKEEQAQPRTSEIRPIQVALTHSSESSASLSGKLIAVRPVRFGHQHFSGGNCHETLDGYRVLRCWDLKLSLAVRFERLAPGSHTRDKPHAPRGFVD